MPHFQIYLPDKVLESLDNQRGSTPRSRLIRELLQVCIQTPGYLEDIARNIPKDRDNPPDYPQ